MWQLMLGGVLEVETCKNDATVARSVFLSVGTLLAVELLKKCTRSWREAHFEMKTSTSEHFWKLSCQKSAPRCGAKHISKSKW